MANNELSGPIVSMLLINYFRKIKNNLTLRFIFIPETIGSISYIHKNLSHLKRYVLGGYNLTCLGDERQYSAMLSKYKDSPSDKALLKAFKDLRLKFKLYSFLKRGSDERQYNSPGVNLKITSVFRSKYGEYPEYHTSLDDFSLVTKKGINGSFRLLKQSIKNFQKNIYPISTYLCEPHMGKRNLYPTLSRDKTPARIKNKMDFLQYSDGKNSLDEISKKIKLKKQSVVKIYNILLKNKLIF